MKMIRGIFHAMAIVTLFFHTACFAEEKAQDKAAACFKLAEHYEKEANKYANDVRDPRKWFDLAMKNYLCASKAGNNLASLRAVQLSSSGQVKPLSKEMSDRLLLQAAEADISDAQIALASDYCDNEGTHELCKNPKEGEKWLLRAARNGSADAAFLLGHLYEMELRGESEGRSVKALACYKLSIQRYQEAINSKGVKDSRQLDSDIDLSKLGVARVLKKLGGKDLIGQCY